MFGDVTKMSWLEIEKERAAYYGYSLDAQEETFECAICRESCPEEENVYGICRKCFEKAFTAENIKKYINETGLASEYSEWLEGDESTEETLKEFCDDTGFFVKWLIK